ncbi:MAG: hypothetical protein JSV49_06400, partial [Thermoplasmata archaeon]
MKAKTRMLPFSIIISMAILLASINSYAQWMPYAGSSFYSNHYKYSNQPYYEYVWNPYNPFSYFSSNPGYGGYFGCSIYMWPYYWGTFSIFNNPWGPPPYWNTPIGHMNFGKDRITPGPVTFDNPKESSLPDSMKGYELYSWQVENDWYFTLITGTNRLKGYEEITSDEDIIKDGWVKITVRDIDSIKTILGQLPKSEEVFWIDDKWLEQVQGET